MNLAERLLNLDRRIIYLILTISAILPFLFPLGLPINVTPEVRSVYDYIEKMPPGSIVLLSVDYDPQTQAENHPQAKAIMRHCFSRGIKLVMIALSQNGPGMAELLIKQIAAEYDLKNGIDFAYLGYKPYPAIVILALGEDFRIPFPEDYYGAPTDSLPLMRKIKNYDDIDLVVSIGAGWVSTSWVTNAHERYSVPVALTVTAVSGPQYYPYVQSKQIIGLIPGLKGAAEYEQLMRDEYERIQAPLMAIQGMDVQSITHAVIVVFILIGNIAFFVDRRKNRLRIG